MKQGEKYKTLQISPKVYVDFQKIRFYLISKEEGNVTADKTLEYIIKRYNNS